MIFTEPSFCGPGGLLDRQVPHLPLPLPPLVDQLPVVRGEPLPRPEGDARGAVLTTKVPVRVILYGLYWGLRSTMECRLHLSAILHGDSGFVVGSLSVAWIGRNGGSCAKKSVAEPGQR